MKTFFITFIFFFVMTTQDSWAQIQEKEKPAAPPEKAVEVTPEELKELKDKELLQTPEQVSTGPDFSAFIAGNLSSSKGDGAILVFAIVGAVVIVAWIPYVVLLALRAAKNPQYFDFHQMLSSQITPLSETGSDTQTRSGVMSSLKYTALSSKKSSPNANFGLNFETGYYNFHDRLNSNGHKQYYHSPYWQIGPSIIFGKLNRYSSIPFLFRIDLTAGTSFHQDVDLILKSELSVIYRHESGIFAGLGLAALYLYGREGKGILSHVADVTLQPTLSLGINF
jgi:hypothetical protein